MLNAGVANALENPGYPELLFELFVVKSPLGVRKAPTEVSKEFVVASKAGKMPPTGLLASVHPGFEEFDEFEDIDPVFDDTEPTFDDPIGRLSISFPKLFDCFLGENEVALNICNDGCMELGLLSSESLEELLEKLSKLF